MHIPKKVLEQLTGEDALKALGSFSGVGREDVKNVLADALPELLKGVESNANDGELASGLERALSEHAKNDTGDLTSFLKNVDKKDSEKILAHLLGDDTAKVEKKAAKDAGLSNAQTAAILTACAPLLLSLLGQHGQSSQSGGGILQALLGGSESKDDDSIGEELLGALLGGSSNNSGNSLGGELLGSLLGGSSGGGLGDGLLETILGEEKKPASSGKKPSSGRKSGRKKKAGSGKNGADTAGEVIDLLGKLLK